MDARESPPVVPGFLAQFEHTVRECAGDPALWVSGQTVSYGDLYNNALIIQEEIAAISVPRGTPIAIHTHNRELAITAMIAILRHGCAYLPLDPMYPEDRLNYMVSHAGAALTVTDNDDFRSPVGSHLDLRDIAFGPVSESAPQSAPITPETDAYVIYTSGSTGKPKGVLMNHGTLDNLIFWQNNHYEPGTRYRTLQFSALSFDVSFQETFSTLSQGGTLYLIDQELKQDFRRLLEFIEEQRIERIFLPYIALLQLVMWANRLRLYPVSLREVITAGEQLVISKELRTAFNALKNATLINQYGPCETHVVSEYALHWPADDWPALPPIGKAIDHAELLILDEERNPVDQDEVGELYIAGPVLAHGYINSPEQTEQRFITLSNLDGQRAYRTGDLVSRDAAGDLLYRGRIDNQVKISGYRVELSEVEARLLDTGLIQEAAAAVQEINGQKKLVAFVTADSGTGDIEASLKRRLQALMPGYMIPSRFYWVDKLRKTPSGKIDRKSMLESLDGVATESSSRQEDLSESLLTIIRRELDLADLVTEDNLQDRGMDSLAANRIAASFYEQQGLSIPVYSLFQYRTLGQFLNYAVTRHSVPVTGTADGPAQTKSSTDAAARDVAIIGMSLRVPGANSLETFWQNLLEGTESITFFTPTDSDSGYVNARGILDDPLGFDDRFFGISPIEAEFIDPQQRLLLELAWHGLENAGYDPEQFAGRIGVYCGVGNNTYYLNNVLKNQEKLEDYGALQAMVANEKDYAATRLAHKLNLVGPALSIHSACSTSLVAVAEAVEAIRQGRCDIAIAGGASLTFPQQQPHTHQEGSIYTRDGHTRPFDKDSSGTVFSDGGGIVVLKRLDEAQKDRDYIYAAITGVAVNNDGAEKGSFSGPSVQGQKSVIQAAINDARLDVNRVGYVEAHGTATPIGDPIEVSALSAAFAEYTPNKQFCQLGSVKSNFGHLTAAAGVAGLIKCALAVDRAKIPQTINFKTPNPELNLSQTPFMVAHSATDWNKPRSERIAGVSSFGIGGTNAHVLLKGTESMAGPDHSATPEWVPLCFSAHSASALSSLLASYQPFLNESNDRTYRAELAAALIHNRRKFRYRIALPQDIEVHDLIAMIEEAEDTEAAFTAPTVAFAFPGQGCQVAGMGRALYASIPAFREAFDECAGILRRQHDLDILSLVFESGDPLKDTQKTQISLFCFGYALFAALHSIGIKPSAAIGHSIGELLAATISGVFDLPTAIRVVMTRGEVMQAQPSGSMLAARAGIDQLSPLLPKTVVVAAENTADACTLSGDHDGIDEAAAILEQNSIKFRALNTSHAFHSPAMDAASEAFSQRLKGVELNAPSLPFISCVTGEWITDQQATDIRYWARQIREPVQFRKGCQTLGTLKNLVVLECGPQGTVSGMALQNLDDKSDLALIPLAIEAGNSDKELASFSRGLGQAWSKGVVIDWPCELANPSLRVQLPGYPFQHRTHVIEPEPVAPAAASTAINAVDTDQVTAIATSQNSAGQSMNDDIAEKLRTLFSDLSGIDLSQADGNATFFELGLDSLLLTQSTIKIKKKFKVNITFRQLLNDYGNLDKLGEYLISQGADTGVNTVTQSVSADVPAPRQTATPGEANATVSSGQPSPLPSFAHTAGVSGEIQSLLHQQMQILQGQLALLSSLSSQPSQGGSTHSSSEGVTGSHDQTRPTTSPIKPFGAGTRINVKRSNEMTPKQQANFDELATRYNNRFARSKKFAQNNRKQLADPRVVSGFRNVIKEVIYPIVVERSEGPYLWDIDGGKLIDVTCGFGSNFFGNSAPFIKDAISRQLDLGYEIGPQHPLVADASRLFCQITGNERVAFCNTGSEAVLGAMRLARTVTAKEKVVIFENDYHGIHDDVIVTRGSSGFAVPAAAGIPEAAVENMIVLDYGNDDSLAYIREHAEEIAAILVEPVQSRNPDLQPKSFLQKARVLCSEKQIALIFDEVITGFRIHPRGAQGYYGIDADICTYGKIVGGGLPIGAISGKAEFMDALDGGQWQFGDDSAPEVGVTYFAGTFVRHPLVLAAAVAVLQRLTEEPGLQDDLNQRASQMVSDINHYAQLVGAPLKIENCGSMCKVKIPQDIAFEELIYILLREKGIHIWDARPMFITTAHSDEDISGIVNAFKQAMDEMIAMDFFPTTQDSVQAANGSGQRPPVEGARLGRDESGKAAWYIPSKTNKNQFEKWAG
ncbi:amino acid adenylation domain-containing protein [Marinobacter sp. M216]|uniref:Amino acid adenylation domain-containing protein n=1 Tax=Marinobacter albus TaxID=3030833 RepID=A0ABT7HBE1_9GAMM|nr:polyketide synthase [Marinobacter sp. M216]MDK9557687.1 amino acid adenylation domain-containing protein [Marinobacter sp. M216]